MKSLVRATLSGMALLSGLLSPTFIHAGKPQTTLAAHHKQVIPYQEYVAQTMLRDAKRNKKATGLVLTGQKNTRVECLKIGQRIVLVQHTLTEADQLSADTLARQKCANKPLYIQIATDTQGIQFAVGTRRDNLMALGPVLSPAFLGGHTSYEAKKTTVQITGKGRFSFLSVQPQKQSIIDAYQNEHTARIDIIDLPKTVAQTLIYEEGCTNHGVLSRVAKPQLFVFHPKHPNGTSLIMCPGGGYGAVALMHEGLDMGPWMNRQGITYAVLKYRLPVGNRALPIGDGHTAIRYMRSHAYAWGLDARKIGIMGASAGGHLASTLATHYTDMTRPDFQVLFYPVVTMGDKTHKGSRYNLLRKQADNQALRLLYSNEKQVTADTPPALILLSEDDGAVPPVNGINYHKALQKHGVSSEIHLYPSGGHGWGFRESFKYHNQVQEAFEKWFQSTIQKGQ